MPATINVSDFLQHKVRDRPSRASRAPAMGTRHAVATSHYLASQAAFQILEAGGNAIDAGVCAGIAVEVLEPHMASVAGVAPIILYHADTGRVISIVGLGVWPKAASCEFFQEKYDGAIPKGVHRTVVPAAPDAWITALELHGSMSFGEVAQAAIGFARDGFRMYDYLHDTIVENLSTYQRWASSAEIYLPGGKPVPVGEMFYQTDTGRALQYMCDEEKAASRGGRAAGLAAARAAFYRGDIAQTILKFYRQEGGLLEEDDLANFRVEVERPVHTRFLDDEVYSCGPWCQGPMMLQTMNLLDPMELRRLGHNSAEYIHTVAEAIKLAAADREAFYGDPRFVDVPIDMLMSEEYARERRKLIRPGEAWPSTPPSGKEDPTTARLFSELIQKADTGHKESRNDTSFVCVVDRHGNGFAATPSDGSLATPVVPGLGMIISGRGQQSWTDPEHPSSIAPGKRPRLTPNPAMALQKGKFVMPFGAPGGDTQTQSMLQAFLNARLFGMRLQEAIDAPRFMSFSFPSSFMPHDVEHGLLTLEKPISEKTAETLGNWGHRIEWWPEWANYGTSVCATMRLESGAVEGGADPRRASHVAIL